MASRDNRRLHTPQGDGLYAPLTLGPQELSAEDSHYVLHVLRLKAGDAVGLFDGTGRTAESVLTPPAPGKRSRAVLNVVAVGAAPVPRCRVAMVVPPPKGERTDWLVEKLTELGVHAIHWLQADFGDRQAERLRLPRLTRLMGSAARQAGIDRLPEQHMPQPLAGCIAALPPQGARYVAHPRAPSLVRTSGPAEAANGSGDITVVVGPEGGLSPAELALLEQHRFIPVGLSAHILRVETAALVAVAALLMTQHP